MGDKKKTLGDFALNPDGKTYKAIGLAEFLFFAMTGKQMSEDEAKELDAEGVARAKARKQDPSQ